MGNKVRIGMIGLGARGKGLLETAYLESVRAFNRK